MKDGYHVNCTVSSNFLLDKGRVAENLQKECFCYFIIICFTLRVDKGHMSNYCKNITYLYIRVHVADKRLKRCFTSTEHCIMHFTCTSVNNRRGKMS